MGQFAITPQGKNLAPLRFAIGIMEFWPPARRAYASERMMGSKRHSAKGRGQRLKNSYAMRYALCSMRSAYFYSMCEAEFWEK